MMNKFYKLLQWNDAYYEIKELAEKLITAESFVINDSTNHAQLLRATRNTPEFAKIIGDKFYPPVRAFIIFQSRKNVICGMHKDGTYAEPTFCAINIPMFGNTGRMEWFDSELDSVPGMIETHEYHGTGTRILDRTVAIKATPVESLLVTCPTLVNTDIWHRVNNIGFDQDRYVLSLRFPGNPSFADMCLVTS